VGRKTRHEVVCEFRCAEILEAARRVFGRKGYGATVDEIAAAAGLAKGTVYLYFPSKREIYLAALRRMFVGLIGETQRSVGSSPSTTSSGKPAWGL
jgi:AcrR family transcriptional regulator